MHVLYYEFPLVTETDKTRFRHFWASLQNDSSVRVCWYTESSDSTCKLAVELAHERLTNRALEGELVPFLRSSRNALPSPPLQKPKEPTLWERLLGDEVGD